MIVAYIDDTATTGLVALDAAGFVTADTGRQTSVQGIFVAGDVRSGSTKQAGKRRR